MYRRNIKNISLFCWNIANPSIERATRQGEWLRKRPEDFLILTETKQSAGCAFLERYFRAYGYHVSFPKLEGREYGTMIVSKYFLQESSFQNHVSFLPGRVAATNISLPEGTLEIIGLYVPSRDASPQKIRRKRRFLESVRQALKNAPKPASRILCGDFNVLEPDHTPHYSFFKEWEYAFYKNFARHCLKDAFRYIHPSLKEYSWTGRTGNGYRYDHCFISENLLFGIKKCFYLHEPKELQLSDHSAIVTELHLTDESSI